MMTDREKVNALFRAALLCLHDNCPPDGECHMCKKAEDYDETICNRCWDDYLFMIVNS